MSQATDMIETVEGSTIQHGAFNDRIYLMKLPVSSSAAEVTDLVEKLTGLARQKSYTKIFAKVRQRHVEPFLQAGFAEEGSIPRFYNGEETACFLGWYLDEARREEADPAALDEVIATANQRKPSEAQIQAKVVEKIHLLGPEHLEAMAKIYRQVFPTYPFPIHEPDYLLQTMRSNVAYFGIERKGQLVSLSSAEMDVDSKNVEMTDFATLPEYQGSGFATQLLLTMEDFVQTEGIKTAYTIARAASYGMNIAFAKNGYDFAGRLINNTDISGQIESMNLWYKPLQ